MIERTADLAAPRRRMPVDARVSYDGDFPMPTPSVTPGRRGATIPVLAIVGVLCVLAALIWQGITSHGAPDPARADLSPTAVILNTGILVFREGLEAILVLAALTASLVRSEERYWRPIAIGSAFSLLATIATWFIVVALLSNISAPALDIQAGTGLLAVVVLLVIMNWFFHKVYWTGWISMHNKRRRALTDDTGKSYQAIFRGLLLVGFTSIYREGFEVVLFLQSLRLRAGTVTVLKGALIGVVLTCIVAVVVFVLNFRLPYRRMLIFTGVMLAAVLVVMVGESVQEMQLAHWLPTTSLSMSMPAWWNTWFAIYPSVQSLVAQAAAFIAVIGSYFVARNIKTPRAMPEVVGR